jgi:cardiolipin synthase
MSWWQSLEPYWGELVTATGTVFGPLLTIFTIVWVLQTKKNSTSAVAWCLLVFFLPLFGPLFFLLFGYQHVNRPLARKRRHRRQFQHKHPPARVESSPGPSEPNPADAPSQEPCPSWEDLSRLARRCGAYPVTTGNHATIYYEGKPALEAMLRAIASARHHVHLESFIFQHDATGRRVMEALMEKARRGVEVRLLYDAMGTRHLTRNFLRPLLQAGGRYSPFLPLNPLRRRIQVNMRNHRKILVLDGRLAFTGGLNIGDEYLGESPRFGYWRDTHLCVEGPAVAGLQRIFVEDWDFAAREDLQGHSYFPPPRSDGAVTAQVIESGPDRELKSIREVYFAAILRARQRVWIASPYFVPDPGLLDALSLAGYMGVDVRLLGLYHPDKWIPFFAARYYWNDVLNAGVKVYQYTRGMMHSKVVIVDGEWASVGTANLDNRSLYLNFEDNCLIYSPALVADLEEAFQHDLETSIRLDRHVYFQRPFGGRLLDNACRLLSPIL